MAHPFVNYFLGTGRDYLPKLCSNVRSKLVSDEPTY